MDRPVARFNYFVTIQIKNGDSPFSNISLRRFVSIVPNIWRLAVFQHLNSGSGILEKYNQIFYLEGSILISQVVEGSLFVVPLLKANEAGKVGQAVLLHETPHIVILVRIRRQHHQPDVALLAPLRQLVKESLFIETQTRAAFTGLQRDEIGCLCLHVLYETLCKFVDMGKFDRHAFDVVL